MMLMRIHSRTYYQLALLVLVAYSLGLSLSHTAWAEALPEDAYIAGVNGHPQTYMLSCESRSAVDWAAFWGVGIGEGEFLSGLPRSDNPDVGFVGNPNDLWGAVPPNSYGVHAGPVADRLRSYGLLAEARHDLSWDELRTEIVAGRPVIVWIIGGMWAGTPRSYTAADGHTTTVANFEHTMLLVGYSSSSVNVIDASTGRLATYPLSLFLNSWAVLGNMAVTGGEMSEGSGSGGWSYTVEGDMTLGLLRKLGVGTEILIKLNSWFTLCDHGQVLWVPFQPPQTLLEPVIHPLISGEGDHLTLLPILQRNAAIASIPQPVQPVEPLAQTEEPSARIYTVQRGDFLIALAKRFGLDWRSLAEINGINFPYVIFPGQVLTLK
jgi:uncharacterized protein YvpB